MHKTFRLFMGQIQEAVNLKFLLALLVGVSSMGSIAVRYLNFARLTGEPINLFEAFIIQGNDRRYMILVFIGYLILISDAPFTNGRTLYAVFRVGKQPWVIANTLKILIGAFFYYSIVLLSSIVITSGKAYIGNVWSDTMYQLVNTPPIQSLDHSIYFTRSNVMEAMSPSEAVVTTLVLNSLYCAALGMVVLVINMNIRKRLGTLVALLLYLAGYELISQGIAGNPKWSLLVHAMPAYHRFGDPGTRYPTISQSLSLFIIMIVVITIVSMFLCRWNDLKSSGTDREG